MSHSEAEAKIKMPSKYADTNDEEIEYDGGFGWTAGWLCAAGFLAVAAGACVALGKLGIANKEIMYPVAALLTWYAMACVVEAFFPFDNPVPPVANYGSSSGLAHVIDTSIDMSIKLPLRG